MPQNPWTVPKGQYACTDGRTVFLDGCSFSDHMHSGVSAYSMDCNAGSEAVGTASARSRQDEVDEGVPQISESERKASV